MKTSRHKLSAKVTFDQARAAMSAERARVVADAQRAMREECVFTPVVFYGYPLTVGPEHRATIRLGWRRPYAPTPDGCTDICTIPAHAYSELQTCRALADKMENFPAFNVDAIA